MSGRSGVIPVRTAKGQPQRTLCVRVQSVHDDYLICRTWNAKTQTVGSSNIVVLKPWELRKSSYHEKSITYADGDQHSYDYTGVQARTVTDVDDDSTESQIIIPPYRPAVVDGWKGSIITAEPVASGDNVTLTIDEQTVTAKWVDCNHAGRAWAALTEAT